MKHMEVSRPQGYRGETFHETGYIRTATYADVEAAIVRQVKEQVEGLIQKLRCSACGEPVEQHYYNFPRMEPVLRLSHAPVLVNLAITPRVVFGEGFPQVFVSVSYQGPSA